MDWKEVANFGVVFLCLAAFALAVWRVISWIGAWLKEKFDPIAEAHLTLIQTLREHTPKQTAAMEQQARTLEEIERSHREQNVMLLKLNSNQETAVKVESRCVEQIVAVNAELQKQTAEIKAQGDSLELHRKKLEELLGGGLNRAPAR